MKVFMLSLVMLIGVSFVGNAEHLNENKSKVAIKDCSGCDLMYTTMKRGLMAHDDYTDIEAVNIATDYRDACRHNCFTN